MANKALWEVLDNIQVSYDDLDFDDLIDQIQDAVGDEYEVDIWDHDDFSSGELANNIVGWINDTSKNKIVEDLQAETWWTSDNEKCFTVVVLKIKEV